MNVRTLAASFATLAALVLLAGCPAPPASKLPEDAPRLVLFLVVDQGRQDYMVRFRPLFTGGLGRLLRESAVFTDARHDHAGTSTAPGHATLATGRHPAGHGVIGNYWYDRGEGEAVYSVEDDQGRHTPERLLTSTFGDWLKEASPASKVFAASGKDRAAILTAGHRADGVFWFDRESGEMAPVAYYDERRRGRDERPWLDAFHEARHVDRLFGRSWEPLPEVEEHAGEYGLVAPHRGWFRSGFPHSLGGAALQPDDGFYGGVYDSPFLDEYLAEFVRALIEAEGLGGDEATDFLGVSFSALDSVGHDYGPDSPEVLDTLLRLDRVLGELLDFVDQKVGLDRVVVTLSADHGVCDLPEHLLWKGEEALRYGPGEIACVQRAGEKLRQELGDEDWVLDGLYLDWELAEERGVEVGRLADAVRGHLGECPGIARVWTRAELFAAPADDPWARLYLHSFHPERSADLFVQVEPRTLTSGSTGTNHGTPHPYDTRVPWLLRLPEGRGLTVDEPVHTVDVAPTLAALVGLEAPADLDGVDRGALLRAPGGSQSRD